MMKTDMELKDYLPYILSASAFVFGVYQFYIARADKRRTDDKDRDDFHLSASNSLTDKLSVRFDKANERIDKLEAMLMAANARINELENLANRVALEKEIIEREKAKLHNEVLEREKEIEKLNKRIDDLETQIFELKGKINLAGE